MKTILSIVPRLPPAIDGVGDYADLLAKALADRHSVSTQFIACDPLQPVESDCELSPIQLPQRSSDSLLAVLDRCQYNTLLLHYVGYGYAKRGCPQWLIDAVCRWRQAKVSRKIVTMFHEVYASSNRPWSSQFWTSSTQQRMARDLANCSDLVLTSTQIYTDKITKLSPKHDGKIQILPIFSTIGECDSSTPLAARKPWLVTFGNTTIRTSIYTNSLEQLTAICQQLEIAEIYDIGNNSAEIIRSVPQVKMNAMGILPAPEISQILGMARVGFLNYPVAYLGKSTIFAAYASHKLLPVADRNNLEENYDGIKLNQHYAIENIVDPLNINSAQKIADNAYQWYYKHSLHMTTDRIAELLISIQ